MRWHPCSPQVLEPTWFTDLLWTHRVSGFLSTWQVRLMIRSPAGSQLNRGLVQFSSLIIWWIKLSNELQISGTFGAVYLSIVYSEAYTMILRK